MIRATNIDNERFLNAIDRLSARMSKTQQRISSGKRIHSIADEPDQIARLLELRASANRIERTQSNLKHFQTEADAAEKAMSEAVKLVERARVLGAQGVSGTQTAATRAGIAVEVRNIVQQLTGIANTYVGGRYLFSGDLDSSAPFAYTPSPSPSVSAYAGSIPTREALGPTGQTFPVAKSGGELFSNAVPERNAFASLIALHDALSANDETAIAESLANITTVGEHLNEQLAFYGGVQNNIADSQKIASELLIRYRTELSAAEDADLVAEISEMTTLELARDATLGAQARFPKRSLFDYLG
jgi:flagellar hook-associated protein 3 FlgL